MRSLNRSTGRLRAVAVLSMILIVGGCQQANQETDMPHETLALLGGRILTLTTEQAPDPNAPVPSAVVISNGRITYVGDDDAARRRAGPSARIIDLAGAVVTPGLIDSHCHVYGLGKALAEIDLVGTTSSAEAVARVAKTQAATPGDGWLQGRGWDQNDWPGKRYPDRGELDVVTGERPTLLRRIDGHAAWANTAALQRAGIGADTPDPDGGQILRDDDGRPTGLLIDNAVDLVIDIIPPPADAEIRRRIELAMQRCVAHGLTGVHTAGITWHRAEIYREMATAGNLLLRVYAMYENEPETLARALPAGPSTSADGMLTFGAVKLYADGALGSRGAYLLADYSDRPGHRGLLVTSADKLREVAEAAGRAGFQVCTHAIGDGGNRQVLDVYADVLDRLDVGGGPGDGYGQRRWRIEHAQILHPGDIPRFADMGVIAAMQPVHCTSDMDWVAERIGPERPGPDRLAGAYAWRTLLDHGTRLCWGTDFPVEDVSALAGLYAARTRCHPDGTPLGGWRAHETVDGYTALRLYTAGSAYAQFAEHDLGRIATGCRGDLTVFDGDPVNCPPDDLLSMRVLLTVVGGRVVYDGR